MSDEDRPPTHQPWGARPPEEQPGGYPTQPVQPVQPAQPGQPGSGPTYGAPPDPYAPPPNPYPQPGTFDQLAAPTPYGTAAPGYGYPGGYPSGYPGGYPGAILPDHPSSTTAMVLGLISLIGIAFCGGLTLVLSPFAWVTGSRAVHAIDAEPGRYGGREKANAGRIMGIIGTVLLVLAVVAIIGLIAVVFAIGDSSNDPGPVIRSGFANS